MYGSPIYGADVSGSLTDQDVNVSIFIKFLSEWIYVLLLRGRPYSEVSAATMCMFIIAE
jgi:hypothetical protein